MVALLATFFGLGKSPIMPGTVGTLGGVVFTLIVAPLGPYPYMALTLLLCLVSLIVAQLYESKFGVHDASEVVIDEVVGYAIAMTWLPFTWQSFVAAFVLFRVLDILKPFPISYLDLKVQGGVGVVIDDVVAGIITNVVLQWVFVKTTWLGMQLQ
jgi:phosphatidylglycerophosphatase A